MIFPQQCHPKLGQVPTMGLAAAMQIVAVPAGQGTAGVHVTDRVVANHEMVNAGSADWNAAGLVRLPRDLWCRLQITFCS